MSTVPFISRKSPLGLSPSRSTGSPAFIFNGINARTIWSPCSTVRPLQSTERIMSRTWPAVITSHPPEGGRAADAADRDDERCGAEGHLALADDARKRRVRLAHVPVE